jgi:hypothetical protein
MGGFYTLLWSVDRRLSSSSKNAHNALQQRLAMNIIASHQIGLRAERNDSDPEHRLVAMRSAAAVSSMETCTYLGAAAADRGGYNKLSNRPGARNRT